MDALEIHPQRSKTISAYHVPRILGFIRQYDLDKFVKRGETLDPEYFPYIHSKPADEIINEQMEVLFDPAGKHHVLSDMIGETVYTPDDCMSGIFQIELNPDMGLNCRLDGVIKDDGEPGFPKSIVLVDDFRYRNTSNKQTILWLRALAAMAIYHVDLCYWVTFTPSHWKSTNWEAEVHKFDFDENEWSSVFEELKEWSLSVP